MSTTRMWLSVLRKARKKPCAMRLEVVLATERAIADMQPVVGRAVRTRGDHVVFEQVHQASTFVGPMASRPSDVTFHCKS